ncbi:unnamed protein product [Vitrella brassicaformis CCMP3155]|uniref:Uncharacterized protein n=1 Tax=Vitrella brassicaformis (strain CCMP3155) TaxID=1169540 RepID=A0A0G4EYR8_VITBC|nr:unnamed protein product [Vitrella brassicaformis CCMP3155]|mmetsp:Transcript_27057/g.67420  ORF Transcript_27057/g.67420 Transcript_27057/m.67420 type:complete len:288 (-) Transcript_27057:193-1056(-)|eukprot:CEM04504.1 unnamed protein product [Vitrella brassicaformis CCMP3155]
MHRGTYGLKTLQANWFEERFALEQPSKDFRDNKTLRPQESYIVASLGPQTKDAILHRTARIPHHRSWAVADFGYREMQTTHRADFQRRAAHPEFVADPPLPARMIQPRNILEVCDESRRPVGGPPRGFGALIDHHDDAHEKMYFDTESRVRFGSPAGYSWVKKTEKADPVTMKTNAGMSSMTEFHKATRAKEVKLVAENYKEGMDPSQTTAVQKAWAPSPDAALQFYAKGKKAQPAPPVDNETSLLLGEGDQVQKHGKGIDSPAYLNCCDLTRNHNLTAGYRIFTDD